MKPPVIHVMTIPGTGRGDVINMLRADGAEVCLHEDPDRNGILYNHLESVACALSRPETWPIFASDDIKALTNWRYELLGVQRHAPHPFVSLTHFSKYGEKLARRGVPFGVAEHSIWGPAFMIHRSVLLQYFGLVNDVASMAYEKYRNWDDGLPTVYNLIYGTKSCMTSRALFQHMDIDSVMGHNLGHWRHAESTIEKAGPPWSEKRTGATGLSVPLIAKELAREVLLYRGQKASGALG